MTPYLHLLISCLSYLITLAPSFAQSSFILMGARSAGLAHASASLKDEWSLFNNIAGTSATKSLQASCAYRAIPSFKPFNSMAFVLNAPSKYGAFSTGIFRFGDDLYSEQVISAGFASKMGLASLGMKANFVQYHIEGVGYKRIATLSAGGIADITKKISVGAYIININQPEITIGEYVPTILTVGTSFKPSDFLLLCVEVSKDIEYDPCYKAGFEYRPFTKIALRTGFNIQPQQVFMGFGYYTSKLLFDYALEHNEYIGAAHQFGIGYKINQP